MASEEGSRVRFCPHGCYWDCEHRHEAASTSEVDPEPGSQRRALMAVHDEDGRELRRCRDCGTMFYDALRHSRDHQRMRQLGLLPAGLPAGWGVVGRRS